VKGRKYAVMAVFAMGMLATLPVGVAAQSPSSAASSPVSPGVLVTGTVVTEATDFTEEDTDVENGRRQRGRIARGHADMSDPRLSGFVTASDNADRFCDGVCGPDTFRADILWGTLEIVNDGGTWVGRSVGTSDMSAEGRGVTYYELVGTGAYEGLSAVLFETEPKVGPKIWNGVIFPGGLPPDR
jgi:hypothetical protein